MSANFFSRLRGLLPDPPLQVGTVVALDGPTVVVVMPGGVQVYCRGVAAVGSRVFVRSNVIEGPAPNLPIETIEV